MLPVSFGTHAIRLNFTVTRSNNFQIPLDYLSHFESISPKIRQQINHHSAIRLRREDVHQQIEVEVFMLNVTANGYMRHDPVLTQRPEIVWSPVTQTDAPLISSRVWIFVTARQIHVPCVKPGSNIWWDEDKGKRRTVAATCLRVIHLRVM